MSFFERKKQRKDPFDIFLVIGFTLIFFIISVIRIFGKDILSGNLAQIILGAAIVLFFVIFFIIRHNVRGAWEPTVTIDNQTILLSNKNQVLHTLYKENIATIWAQKLTPGAHYTAPQSVLEIIFTTKDGTEYSYTTNKLHIFEQIKDQLTIFNFPINTESFSVTHAQKKDDVGTSSIFIKLFVAWLVIVVLLVTGLILFLPR